MFEIAYNYFSIVFIVQFCAARKMENMRLFAFCVVTREGRKDAKTIRYNKKVLHSWFCSWVRLGGKQKKSDKLLFYSVPFVYLHCRKLPKERERSKNTKFDVANPWFCCYQLFNRLKRTLKTKLSLKTFRIFLVITGHIYKFDCSNNSEL